MKNETKIQLVPISLDRVSDYLVWFNDKDVRKFLKPTTPKTEKEITDWIREITDSDKVRYFSIFLPEQNQFIGHVGLKNINLAKKQAEIGIVIGEKKFWRKGIGTKAVLKILEYSRKLELKRITAEVQKENKISQKLFSKLGFTKLATKQKGFLRLVLEL